MEESLKSKLTAFYNRNVQKGWYKAWTFILNVLGFLIATGPELINMALSSMPTALDQMPTLDAMDKFYVLMAVNVLSILLKPWLQKKDSLLPAAAARPNAGDPGG